MLEAIKRVDKSRELISIKPMTAVETGKDETLNTPTFILDVVNDERVMDVLVLTVEPIIEELLQIDAVMVHVFKDDNSNLLA